MDSIELTTRLETDPTFVLLLAKKMIILNLSLGDLSVTLPGGADRSLLLEVFVLRPDLQKVFYDKVTSVAEEEADLIQRRSVPNALQRLADIVAPSTGEVNQADVKDIIAASRAILQFSDNRGRKSSNEPGDPLDDIYRFVNRGHSGS